MLLLLLRVLEHLLPLVLVEVWLYGDADVAVHLAPQLGAHKVFVGLLPLVGAADERELPVALHRVRLTIQRDGYLFPLVVPVGHRHTGAALFHPVLAAGMAECVVGPGLRGGRICGCPGASPGGGPRCAVILVGRVGLWLIGYLSTRTI